MKVCAPGLALKNRHKTTVDLHGSKPLISLVAMTCTVYCYQG